MMTPIKNQAAILKKLKIEKLNAMQLEAQSAIQGNVATILLSPTGTGKTLAFLLPIIANLKTEVEGIQALIVVPSRELAIQIEQVVREMGSGYKTNAFYGGRSFSKDRLDLKHPPAILIGTPGRIADHIRRKTFSLEEIKMLVLDEFDKSLEIGFESDMKTIVLSLRGLRKKVLTSATHEVEIPAFMGMRKPVSVNYLTTESPQLTVKTVVSPSKDKLKTLVATLSHIGNEPGIIFCNFKDSINRVSEFLKDHRIRHGCFYGGMEQQDRERALIKFRNGSHQLIVATDLAARGLDIPEIKFIIHYQLPRKSREFTHRNGRTARMNKDGTAYVIHWANESLPDFIEGEELALEDRPVPKAPKWKTIFISGGRKDKISKGDIAGWFFKQGQLEKDELGMIELKQDCAFVAVPSEKVIELIKTLDNTRIKKKKVRISLA